MRLKKKNSCNSRDRIHAANFTRRSEYDLTGNIVLDVYIRVAIMAVTFTLQKGLQNLSPVFTSCAKPPLKLRENHHLPISRRAGAIAVMTWLLQAREAFLGDKVANSFEFRMTVPDQTVEEAESMIRDHAQALLQVKSLLESESWKEAQQQLRKASSYLKQDIYTIIQSKAGSIRPQLRKLYSDLFNSVTKLDYAARDRDAPRVWENYNNVEAALGEILSRIKPQPPSTKLGSSFA
ncbi:hypothetical protein Ancab_023912 [Ancistrocladus abbreviatus]